MTRYVSNRDGGKTSEEGHFRFQIKSWEGNVQNGLSITQNSPLAMSVLVLPGDIKIDYADYGYTAWSDSNEVITIATADPSNPRIDRIIAYIDRVTTPSTATSNNPGLLKFMVVAGTPAGSPTRPADGAVTTAVGASNPWAELADVRVNSGVTTISNSNITDKRLFITPQIRASSIPTAAYQDDSVTIAKVDSTAVGFGDLLLGSTSNSAQTSISLSSLPARKWLKVRIGVSPSTSMSIKLTFNNDTGNNYAFRTETDGAAQTTGSTTFSIQLATSTAAINHTYDLLILNNATSEKTVTGTGTSSASGVGSIPNLRLISGKWVNTVDLISRIDVTATTGNLGAAYLQVIGSN